MLNVQPYTRSVCRWLHHHFTVCCLHCRGYKNCMRVTRSCPDSSSICFGWWSLPIAMHWQLMDPLLSLSPQTEHSTQQES